jgi:predicted nucleotidyltransferase
MVQFNPLAIAKPFLIALDAWRFQVHRRAQLRAGGVLWGAFVYSNRAPLRVDSVNIELMCTQDVAINTKEGDQLVGVQTVATIVQSSRQVCVPQRMAVEYTYNI